MWCCSTALGKQHRRLTLQHVRLIFAKTTVIHFWIKWTESSHFSCRSMQVVYLGGIYQTGRLLKHGDNFSLRLDVERLCLRNFPLYSLRMIVADSHYDLDIGTWKFCATILWLSPTSFFSRVSKHLFRLYVGRQKKQRITAWTNIGNKQRYYFPTWDDRKKERQWIGCRKCGPFNCSYVEAKIAPKSVTTNLFHFCATLVHKPLKLNFLEEKHPKTKRSFASLAWRIRLPFLKTCALNRWNGLYPTRVLKVSDRVGFKSLFDFLRLQNDYAQFCMWAL